MKSSSLVKPFLVIMGALLTACGGNADLQGDGGNTPPDDGGNPSIDDAGSTSIGDAGLAAAPSSPPALICGNTSLLAGPSTPPAGAITVPVGDNSSFNFGKSNAVYWFAPGTHTLGTGQYSQIIPANGSTFIGGPGAILDGQHLNNYAFTQGASNVTIEYLTIQNFGQSGGNFNEGVVNHDFGPNWLIQYNTITGNAGAGIMIGPKNVIRYNCVSSNGQHGFNGYGATGSVVVDHNEIAGNNTDDWEARIDGCGCTGGGKFWATNGGVVTNNYVHDNLSVGIWADTNNTGFDIEGNYIANNSAEGIMYEISYNALIRYNTLIRNGLVKGPTNPGFPTGAIYISESGGDARVGSTYSTFEISGNVFIDNWSGVVLWENADRFVGNPDFGDLNNLLTDVTYSSCYAAFDPSGKSTASPVNPSPSPYFADCRWHTQNVQVHDNVFTLNSSNLTNCSASTGCGFNGVFSNLGSEYSWEPYSGDVVEQAITFSQNNVFSHNTYTGPWSFMPHDMGTILTHAQWQGAPYNQDVGSAFH